jgi:DNA-directed RNA polymerase specialized sigma24 family protein
MRGIFPRPSGEGNRAGSQRGLTMHQIQRTPVLLLSVDSRGREIAPNVFEAAQHIAPKAIDYATKDLGDPSVALTLLEEAAAAVSRTLHRKANTPAAEVRDLQAYLFRAFLRHVNAKKRKDLLLSERLERGFREEIGESVDPDTKILVEELMSRCDPRTRAILFQRVQGYSWNEIGDSLGITGHAARLRASKALEKLRAFALGQKNGTPRGPQAPLKNLPERFLFKNAPAQ